MTRATQFARRLSGLAALVALAAAQVALAQDKPRAGFVELFNGKDLAGWKATGKAEFFVKDGCLVGTQNSGDGGDLMTEKEWDNFELRVTYRMVWPANSGFWFRFGPSAGYQYDVLKWPNPVAFSGTLYCPGKLFLTRNLDEPLEHRDGWNEARVWANGDQIILWLNGRRVGQCSDNTLAKGRFGIQVHGGGFKGMKIIVKRFAVRSVPADEKPPVDAKLKAVLWTGGFAHDFDAIAKVLTEVLPKHLPIDLRLVHDGKFLDTPDAAGLDVIVMDHCFQAAKGVLTDSQKAKLLELVRGGAGVVALHASYYSFLKWDDYRELFGAKFTQHADSKAQLVVTVVDANHAVTQGLGKSFEVVSELYESTPLAKDCHVLARAKDKSKTQDHPSAWTRMVGKGRVVTILPGHWPDSYRVEGFQRLIASAVQWAARLPQPAASE